ncbi:hypothetical protein NIES4071_89920 [Calothrix sp. NIES-4071]|nr:hypothetical protein NIES4071_89920 [Calothrix sp. NIES-4071]BAZ63259.1 hypothetical protein NIES4105_89850 [Calothrix sp. NIES-4105]
MLNPDSIERLIKIGLPEVYVERKQILISSDKSEFHTTDFCIDNLPINQCYRISQKFHEIKIIISSGKLFISKYDWIIWYEYYSILEPSGYLLILTEKNYDELNIPEYFQSKFKLLNQFHVEQNTYCFCLQKTDVCNLYKLDDIQKWSFGFITNGSKNEFINEQINRIANLGLDEWEVVICGTFELSLSHQEHVKYIPFTEQDDKGWITRKKNLICQAATYENLVILHDRYIIPLDFLEKMKLWGNNFDLLGARQIYYPSPLDRTPIRCQDWMTYSRPLEVEKKDRSCDNIGLLQAEDWDKWCYITGGLYIVKRSLMLKVPQDEDLFWNEVEDIKFCHDFTKAGYLIRFNPYLIFESVSYRWTALAVQYNQNQHQLGEKRISQETLTYWYLLLLDLLFLSNEIKQALNLFADDFLNKIKHNILHNPNNCLNKIQRYDITKVGQLKQFCQEILLMPQVYESIKNIDKVTQTRLAFNLILGRSPSPHEEVIWLEKHKPFDEIVIDLLSLPDFQYKISNNARAKYTKEQNYNLLLKIILLIKPLILFVIALITNLVIFNPQIFVLTKKIIKTIIFK